jgi:hypothetical protein
MRTNVRLYFEAFFFKVPRFVEVNQVDFRYSRFAFISFSLEVIRFGLRWSLKRIVTLN